MASTRALAIVRTIVYSDVFDHPLTGQELYRWLISARKTTPSVLFENTSQQLSTDGQYFYLKGRSKIVRIRTERQETSREKLKIARQIAKHLLRIPTVTCIGLTGALAMDNVSEDDDIDICIIASYDTVWITRFLVVLILELFGVRRRPYETNVHGKVCANMFIDENHLELPKKERDLYAAHEVLQMKPLWVRGDTYRRFLRENNWLSSFLPNAYNQMLEQFNHETIQPLSLFQYIVATLLGSIEPIAQRIQLWYMNKHRTIEVIQEGYLRFHPQDARIWVMREYRRRLEQLKIAE